MEPGEAIAELGREDVPPGAGPLTQLDEGGPRCFGDPQQSIQPPSGPAGGQQGQRGEEEKGPKFEEQHKCTECNAEQEDESVDLDFSKKLPFRGSLWKNGFLASGRATRCVHCTQAEQRNLGDVG